MASIFEGIEFKSPLEVQQDILREQQAQLAQMNSRQGAGYMLGTALSRAISRFRTGEKRDEDTGLLKGFVNRMRTGTGDPRIREAEMTQETLGRIAQAQQEEIESGADPTIARIRAMKRAASEFTSMGRPDYAAQLQSQAMQLQAQFEIQQAELAKLKADTRLTEVQTDQLMNPAPPEPKDSIIRLQNERDRLTAELMKYDPNSEAAMTIARRLDEVNAAIQKDITIVGRTEHDVGPQRTTLQSIEENLLATQDQLDLINEAMANFDPSFYTMAGRIKTGSLKLRDILGAELTQEEKVDLVNRVTNLQAMSQALNAYIKAVTGAQMSEAEAERLMRDMPDPGKDGPAVLQAKLERWAWRIPAIQARARAALQAQDLSIINTPLEQWRTDAAPRYTPEQADALRSQAKALLGLE